MYKPSPNDINCIKNMLECIDKIQKYACSFKSPDAFYKNELAFDATLMNFIVIGEMTTKLTPELIDGTSRIIDWFKIKGFRNIVAHNYFGIDAEEVWQIVHRNLPELKVNLKRIIGNT